MSHDGGTRGKEHDDSPWHPDAVVTFEHPPRRSFDDQADRDRRPQNAHGDARSTEPPASRSRASLRTGFGLAAAALLVVGGATVVWSERAVDLGGGLDADAATRLADGDERTDTIGDRGGDVTLGPGDASMRAPVGCGAQRLPLGIEPLWTEQLSATRSVISPITVSADSVVVIVRTDQQNPDGSSPVSVVALDLDDGGERWRADLRASTGNHEVLGVVDGTVIVSSAGGPDTAFRRLFAFDEDSGAALWDRGFRGDWTAQVDAATGLVHVGVRRPSATTAAETEVEVLDLRGGYRRHVAAGASVGIDPAGRLITRRGDKILATSPSDRELLGVVVPSDSPFATLGTDVVVATDNGNAISVYSGSTDPQVVPLAGTSRIEPPGFVVGLEPLGRSSLVVTGGGAVHGAEVRDEAVDIRWRVSGVVVESAASDRGRSLLVATEGGARQRVIDGSTGRAIADVVLSSGSYATLAMVSNGVVVPNFVDGELSRAAVDLDGRPLWTLAGGGPVAIGDGVVVAVDETADGIGVTAFGEPLDSPTEAPDCPDVPGTGTEAAGTLARGVSASDG